MSIWFDLFQSIMRFLTLIMFSMFFGCLGAKIGYEKLKANNSGVSEIPLEENEEEETIKNESDITEIPTDNNKRSYSKYLLIILIIALGVIAFISGKYYQQEQQNKQQQMMEQEHNSQAIICKYYKSQNDKSFFTLYSSMCTFDYLRLGSPLVQFGNPIESEVRDVNLHSKYNLQFIFRKNGENVPFYTSAILEPGECTDVPYQELLGVGDFDIWVTCIAYNRDGIPETIISSSGLYCINTAE